MLDVLPQQLKSDRALVATAADGKEKGAVMGDTATQLRDLAPTMTQAEAARALKISRARVGQLASAHEIAFVERDVAPAPVYCGRCRRRLHDGYSYCLRCKWTPRAIKRLRKRYGLSQVRMSVDVLKMNLWSCARWESGRHKPNRQSLVLLEALEIARK